MKHFCSKSTCILKRPCDFLLYTKMEMSQVLFYDKICLLPRALGLCRYFYLPSPKQHPVNISFPKLVQQTRDLIVLDSMVG